MKPRREPLPNEEVCGVKKNAYGDERKCAAKIIRCCGLPVKPDCIRDDCGGNRGEDSADDAAESFHDNRRKNCDETSQKRARKDRKK